jgi:hypothetical protein
MQMLIKKHIPRRRFLQGLGGSMIALPLLEANAETAALVSPKRIAATGIFYGFVPENFHPIETGKKFQSPLLLKPLESLRQDYTVFSGLDHNLSGGHNATKFFLSGVPYQPIERICGSQYFRGSKSSRLYRREN